jgi:hypothetical protein
MNRDFFDPPWERTNVVLIDEATLVRAQRRILSCEECNREAAEFPFDSVLDEITGCDPLVTDYVFVGPAKCSRCLRQILEKALVEGE